jgi:hypothetical protein
MPHNYSYSNYTEVRLPCHGHGEQQTANRLASRKPSPAKVTGCGQRRGGDACGAPRSPVWVGGVARLAGLLEFNQHGSGSALGPAWAPGSAKARTSTNYNYTKVRLPCHGKQQQPGWHPASLEPEPMAGLIPWPAAPVGSTWLLARPWATRHRGLRRPPLSTALWPAGPGARPACAAGMC